MIELIVSLVVLAVMVGILETIVPMNPTLKALVRGLIAIAVLIWFLRFFGLTSGHFLNFK